MTDGSSMENHYILYLKLDMEDKEVHLKPDMDMEVNLRLDMEVNLRLDMEVMQGHTMLVEVMQRHTIMDTIFAELIEEAKRAASDGGTMSRFSLTVKLLQAKSYYRISNVAFNAILLILALQYPNSSIPKSYEEALSIVGRLGLGYESIHVCPNNCVLFRKDYAKENNCPKCKASRWKDADGRRKIPEKVLRHFPLIPRLQRMFLSKEQSKEVQWHKLKRQDVENDLSHPADGDAWKDFDNIHKDFAADARNIRLGLATDGFNPYGNMSNSYSMWPVFVVPYNLPPWACMDQSNFMLALLIPGPSSPGKDFDVFMEPLMEELQELWKGVKSVRYHTVDREKNRKTQNSGIVSEGDHDGNSIDFFGQLKSIIRLQYNSSGGVHRSVVLFRCDWFDLGGRKPGLDDDGHFKSVNTEKFWYKTDPFLLTSQATKVFYVPDTKLKGKWQVVQKFHHRHLWSVKENEQGPGVAVLSYQDEDSSQVPVQEKEGTARSRTRSDQERVLLEKVIVDKLKKHSKEVVPEEIEEVDQTMYQYCSDEDDDDDDGGNRTRKRQVFEEDE
ncbi:hypothetical protein QYE76_045348 [Lolium multiflorum]|uniref:DUF4216 domain-containing protein n=1 Tax=Lolium multiflorum TaxID=4521 RepID=A0AAD8R0F6_LOLMU|nr:hypothetical protein QYE76_034126 [Lolium multiflorum]KAK1684500.1 hypothetical protein QYE76_045348 [Lolium multiflorum]